MISASKVKDGDNILIKSLITKKPIPATVIGRKSIGDRVVLYVDCGTKIAVEESECFYDTEENRERIVNKHPY